MVGYGIMIWLVIGQSLGLAICIGFIVERMKGRIESIVGGGKPIAWCG
jgi:hypothetical protein